MILGCWDRLPETCVFSSTFKNTRAPAVAIDLRLLGPVFHPEPGSLRSSQLRLSARCSLTPFPEESENRALNNPFTILIQL